MADTFDLLGSFFNQNQPEYMTGLLGEDAANKLKQRAATTGLINMAVGYLAQPKNQRLGLGRILANSYMAGQEGAQQTVNSGLNDWLTAQKVNEMKRQQAKQAGLQAALANYGKPNSQQTSSVTENVPAPQGADSPNFNTVPQTTTTQTPAFDKQEWLRSVLPNLDEKEAVGMLLKQGTITWQDTGNGLIQLSDGQPTGLMLPKGVSPSDLLHARTTMYTHDTQSADNKATNATSIQNNQNTQAGENARAAAKDDPLGLNKFIKSGGGNVVGIPKVATLQDIADTAKASGKSTAQVTADLKAKGYTIQGVTK